MLKNARTFLLSLLFVAILGHHALARECEPSLVIVDYAIENDYPNVQVVPGYVATGSKSFIRWRSKTSQWIPDSAFNYHYYSPRQMLDIGRWAEVVPGATYQPQVNLRGFTQTCLKMLKVFSDNKGVVVQHHTSAYFFEMAERLRAPLKAQSIDVKDVFRRAGLTPELTPRRFREILLSQHYMGRYLIDQDGVVYILSKDDVESLRPDYPLYSELYHDLLAELILGDYLGRKEHYFIDMGNFRKLRDGTFEISQRYGAAKEFDSLKYIMSYIDPNTTGY